MAAGPKLAMIPIMTTATRDILDLALSLPEAERRVLVEALSDSLEENVVELSDEWRDEIADRIARVERGEAELIEWSVVEARVREILARR